MKELLGEKEKKEGVKREIEKMKEFWEKGKERWSKERNRNNERIFGKMKRKRDLRKK